MVAQSSSLIEYMYGSDGGGDGNSEQARAERPVARALCNPGRGQFCELQARQTSLIEYMHRATVAATAIVSKLVQNGRWRGLNPGRGQFCELQGARQTCEKK